MIRIHNSLTGQKQNLEPVEPGHVRMYSCGVTVYDYFHVGNARMLVVFDMVSRYLRHRGYRVTYVRNITDVDDKIINRAREAGVDWRAHAAKFTAAMHEDLDALGCLRPEKEPKASEYIDEMLSMIGALIERGYAYQGSSGDVLYDVHKFAAYGKLSGKKLEDLRAGARVEVDSAKRDPLDFVLWKSAKPGEPAWSSPWGEGRPGWHIECSTMSTKELGEHFDIHGGGLDLKFPHHENEIAQTCGATGGRFAEIWMHNGFLNIDNEKMSKSLGNFFTTREVLAKIRHPEVLRFFLLSSHYRGPMNYSPEQLDQADATLRGFYRALEGIEPDPQFVPGAATKAFWRAMDDDFNTPEAIAVLQGVASELNIATAALKTIATLMEEASSGGELIKRARGLAAELKHLGAPLGLLQGDPKAFGQRPRLILKTMTEHLEIKGHAPTVLLQLSKDRIDELVRARDSARTAKNWAESDRIRGQLDQAGVVVKDKQGAPSEWEYK